MTLRSETPLATDQRFCTGCRFHKKWWFPLASMKVRMQCTHPLVIERHRGAEKLGTYRATGSMKGVELPFCDVERAYDIDNPCGPPGRLYEAKGYNAKAHSECYP